MLIANVLRRCALLLILTSCAGTQLETAPNAIEGAATRVAVVTREERIAVDPETRTLRLRNPHGDVRVRITEQPTVGIYATIQRIGAVPLDPQFEIRQRDGLFELTIRYPDEATLLAQGDHGYGRVDLAVWVPEELALDLATTTGLLQVRGARSAVRARTTSGDLHVSSGSGLELASDSGNIAMSQTTGTWDTPVRVISATGHVYASVPVFADVALSVVAGGRIEVDAGLPRPIAGQQGMTLQARFGRAQHAMRIESARGDVYLYRVIGESERAPSDVGSPPR